MWDRSEDVAFLGTLVSPSVESITVSDTLRSMDDQDSIVTRPGVHYMPDDLLLTWFNEDFRSQYLRTHDRPERQKVILGFAAPHDTLPTLTIVGGPLNGRNLSELSVLEESVTKDSMIYWLRDPEVLAIDSLMLDVRHQYTDTLDRLVWQNDTIRFFFREPKQKKKKKKEEEEDSIPKRTPLDFKMTSKNDIYAPIVFHSATPLASLDTAAIHLEMTQDTIWEPAHMDKLRPDSLNPILDFVLDFDRRPGWKYKLTVDSAAVVDIYGLHNDALKQEFTVKQPEEYASLIFNLQGLDSIPAVVELLDASDKVVKTLPLGDSKRAVFQWLDPGTFYARLFLDANNNGKWDTGNIGAKLQPEEVYYYPKKLDVKANWDIEQPWNIYEQPLDRQKPNAIKKNKPKLRKGEVAPTDEDVEYDEWGNPIDPNDPSYVNGSGGRRNNNRNGNRGNNISIPGRGGFQMNTGNATIRR